jgi:hypothetical protein
MVFHFKASEYWTPENKIQFQRGFTFGTFIISLGTSVLMPQIAVAADGTGGAGGSPTPIPGKSAPIGSLVNVPTADRGAYAASALGICAIAMKSGAFWVGFRCAGAVISGVRMAAIPANGN